MSRNGFTLLEVLLALVLTSLLTVMLDTAIDIHLRVVDLGRIDVEEAQLARALLHRIADDLRSAVHYSPPDTSESAAGLSAEPAASDDQPEAPTGQPGPELAEADEPVTDTTGDLAASSAPASVPGLYGNQYELQVDVSHLPRLDQYESLLEADGDSSFVDPVSDVKTVAYYVIDPLQSSPIYTGAGTQDCGGLVRRELDRAVTAWAAEQGQLVGTDQDQEPIAPEVTAIEFRYFDGSEFVDEWDSDAQGGLPVAVEIAVAIRPVRRGNTWFSSRQTSADARSTDDKEPLVYRLLVHLPTAQPTTSETTFETLEELDEPTDLGSLE